MGCKNDCGCKHKITYTNKASYKVPAGEYTSNSLIGLVWEVLKHRTWHLFKHGRWMD